MYLRLSIRMYRTKLSFDLVTASKSFALQSSDYAASILWQQSIGSKSPPVQLTTALQVRLIMQIDRVHESVKNIRSLFVIPY